MARRLMRFVAAVVIAALAAIVFHTLSVLAGLSAIGVELAPATVFEAIWRDLTGLAPSYGAVIAIALALGFAVAAWLKPRAGPIAPLAYPLAGAAAMAAALALMHVAYGGITPIAGARGMVGFLMQCGAGGLGGLVFGLSGAVGKQR